MGNKEKSRYNLDGRAEQARLIQLGQSVNPEFVDAKRIVGHIRWAAEDRLPNPHRISDLMLRKEKGKGWVLAAFISYYTMDHIMGGQMPRPSEWLTMDLVSGTPIARYKCEDIEFSDAPYDTLYTFTLETECDISPEYYRLAYALLDEARISIMQTAELDQPKYTAYVKAIIANTPNEYQRFFLDLGRIKVKKAAPDNAPGTTQ